MDTDSEKLNGNATKLRSEGKKFPQFLAAVIVNILAFCAGHFIGWPSVAIPILMSSESPIGEPMTNEEVSVIVSIVCAVTLFGVPVVNYIISKYGNKIIGYINGVSFFLAWIIIIFTATKTWIYIARCIGGVAIACMMVLVPQYVAEISEDSVRGILGVLFVLLFTIGLLFINSLAAFLSYKSIAITCAIPPLIFLGCFIKIPNAPINLLLRGKEKEARDSLQWLRGKETDISEEMEKLKASVEATGSKTMSVKEMMKDRGTRRGLLIVSAVCINSQFSGIFVIISFLGSIFLEAGISLSHVTASIIVASLQLFGSILSTYFVERKGRRFLLIVSNIGITICLAALGIFFFLKELGSDVSAIFWLPIASLSTYMIAISIGVGPLPFVILTEMCLPSAQKFATILGYTIIWGLSLLLATCFKPLSVVLGIYTCYWFFALSCLLGAVFTYFYIPETKGRPIQEIYLELSGHKEVSVEKGEVLYNLVSTNADDTSKDKQSELR